MKEQTPSQIFHSEKRNCEETDSFKRFYTFGLHDADCGNAFGKLKFLNDEFLSPKKSVTYYSEEDSSVFLLPLTGSLGCCTSPKQDKNEVIKSEQIKYFQIKQGEAYTFNNPYEKEWVNYLHVGLKKDCMYLTNNTPSVHDIKFEKINTLAPMWESSNSITDSCEGTIGVFESRTQENYYLKDHTSEVFVYVINGVFDVEGRLIEGRDGLRMWDVSQIEFEALTENAIIMFLETKNK